MSCVFILSIGAEGLIGEGGERARTNEAPIVLFFFLAWPATTTTTALSIFSSFASKSRSLSQNRKKERVKNSKNSDETSIAQFRWDLEMHRCVRERAGAAIERRKTVRREGKKKTKKRERDLAGMTHREKKKEGKNVVSRAENSSSPQKRKKKEKNQFKAPWCLLSCLNRFFRFMHALTCKEYIDLEARIAVSAAKRRESDWI